jgi:hypothetical protein
LELKYGGSCGAVALRMPLRSYRLRRPNLETEKQKKVNSVHHVVTILQLQSGRQRSNFFFLVRA